MKKLSSPQGQAITRLRGFCRATASSGASDQARSTGDRPRIRLRSGNEGQTLVEFALVMPMLLAVFLGIFSFGLYVWNYESLTQAVGVGAQYLSSIRGDSTITDPCAAVLTAIKGASPTLNSSKINLSFTLTGASPTGSTCPGDQAYLIQGQPVSVTATYPCSLIGFATSCLLQAQMTVYEY